MLRAMDVENESKYECNVVLSKEGASAASPYIITSIFKRNKVRVRSKQGTTEKPKEFTEQGVQRIRRER